MAASPPHTLPESEALSDDSGVEVTRITPPATSENKRNKRKSSEPRKRKDGLLMKRFQWDTTTEWDEERPSSGDSGCQLEEEEEEGGQSAMEEGRSRPPAPRNYKGMSRQRRIEANARERTRVHTISAAFESLRRAVPAYAHNQKLSKLAILRIASAYIVALACLNEGEGATPPMPECVEQCTRTIQAEGRSRRRTFKD